MEERRTPWPVLALVGLVAVLVGAYTISHVQRSRPSSATSEYGLCCAPEPTLPFDLSSAAPALHRGGPPGSIARDNAEYPVGTGPSDELLPGRWMAYPPGHDCKWTIQIPPAPGVEMVMVTQPDGRQEIEQTQWIAGSTETHWSPGTAIYVQLDAGVRFQTVNCGTWVRTNPSATAPSRAH